MEHKPLFTYQFICLHLKYVLSLQFCDMTAYLARQLIEQMDILETL